MILYKSNAIVQYGPKLKAIAIIDQNISDYYRKLIPKYKNAKSQAYKAHITIVRLNKEIPLNMEFWGKYENKNIVFEYNPIVQNDENYYWLDAYSEDISKIRKELGLPEYRDDTKFGGLKRSSYHITIANTKNVHSA